MRYSPVEMGLAPYLINPTCISSQGALRGCVGFVTPSVKYITLGVNSGYFGLVSGSINPVDRGPEAREGGRIGGRILAIARRCGAWWAGRDRA